MKQGDARTVAADARAPAAGGARGSDTLLVVAAKTGDARAFGELYERYRDALYRFCLARTGSSHDAEDLVADVFVKALQSLDRYQDRGLPFAAFLYRIARNAAIDRRRVRRQPLSADALVSEPSSGQDVEREAALGVERSILLTALTRLKTDHREVIVLRFIEGYAAAEVAAMLGRTEGAVRTLQHRALGHLRREFGEVERLAAKRTGR